MTFGIRKTVTPGVNYGWLGSAHATDAANTVTIDIDSLTPSTHYPNGFIPSGFAIAPSGDLWKPFVSSTDDVVRFVLEPVPVTAGQDIVAAAIWHGEINNDELPFPLDATGITKAENGQFTINEDGGS